MKEQYNGGRRGRHFAAEGHESPFAGKKILIVGMARSGVALARLLHGEGALVTVSDQKPWEKFGGQLEELRERFTPLGLTLEVPEETLLFLARQGLEEGSGARPLRRLLQSSLEDRAAELLLAGQARPGDRLSARIRDGAPVLEVLRDEGEVREG